ncbi:RibD family protein [Desulfobotulus sp. H1]|uniref:RibD family protein n=1 Tax=Desulfobotulus pelophilus TaxID=2823377 RepID=A0ABT3NBT1_9BACT|nr:RibD family protein [Desulfobotulus pelophilus]MCW7754914.1 RibD family protein [Desulfobotulus pelophilus]
MLTSFLIAATTLCGHIGPCPFSSPEDRQHLELWRDRTDASLMGASTLRNADPEMRGSNRILHPGRIRALITASGHIPFDHRSIFTTGPPPLIFTRANLRDSLQEHAGSRAEVLAANEKNGSLDIHHIRAILEKRGCRSLLVEGGGGLNRSALEQDAVDELLLTLCPVLYGKGNAVPLIRRAPTPMDRWSWQLLEHKTGTAGEIFLRYARKQMAATAF